MVHALGPSPLMIFKGRGGRCSEAVERRTSDAGVPGSNLRRSVSSPPLMLIFRLHPFAVNLETNVTDRRKKARIKKYREA